MILFFSTILRATHTWASKDADELRRASTVIADRDNIAERAFFVLPHRLEHVDQVVCSAAAREDDNALGLEAAVDCWRSRCGVVGMWREEGLDSHGEYMGIDVYVR
jgi:hypothetical protein